MIKEKRMTKKIFLTILLMLITVPVWAKAKPVIQMNRTTCSGTIIDNKCAKAQMQNLTEFIKTHTKECALMPECSASGYSFYTDGRLVEFTKDSTSLIIKFLQEKNSQLQAEAVVENLNGRIRLISIKSQKTAK
jgi:hypothetical protein